MTLVVKRYTEANQEEWDDFIATSANGTFMQEKRFLNYHPIDRFVDHSLIFSKDNRIIALLPAAQVAGKDTGNGLISHPGASHGGLIIKSTLSTSGSVELVGALLKYCAEAKFAFIRIKPVPRIYQYGLTDQLDFALRFLGFKLEYTELATALELQRVDGSLLKGAMSSTAFRNYHKALKSGLRVVEEGNLTEYWPILINKLKQNHNATPAHSLEEIKYLKNIYPEKVKLFMAYQGNEPTAGVLVFLLNKRVMNCFYIAHDDQYQQMRPLNLVFGYMMQWGQKNNFSYLDWGISTEAKGSRINSELFRFKEGFGGHGVLRESYGYSFAQ